MAEESGSSRLTEGVIPEQNRTEDVPLDELVDNLLAGIQDRAQEVEATDTVGLSQTDKDPDPNQTTGSHTVLPEVLGSVREDNENVDAQRAEEIETPKDTIRPRNIAAIVRSIAEARNGYDILYHLLQWKKGERLDCPDLSFLTQSEQDKLTQKSEKELSDKIQNIYTRLVIRNLMNRQGGYGILRDFINWKKGVTTRVPDVSKLDNREYAFLNQLDVAYLEVTMQDYANSVLQEIPNEFIPIVASIGGVDSQLAIDLQRLFEKVNKLHIKYRFLDRPFSLDVVREFTPRELRLLKLAGVSVLSTKVPLLLNPSPPSVDKDMQPGTETTQNPTQDGESTPQPEAMVDQQPNVIYHKIVTIGFPQKNIVIKSLERLYGRLKQRHGYDRDLYRLLEGQDPAEEDNMQDQEVMPQRLDIHAEEMARIEQLAGDVVRNSLQAHMNTNPREVTDITSQVIRGGNARKKINSEIARIVKSTGLTLAIVEQLKHNPEVEQADRRAVAQAVQRIVIGRLLLRDQLEERKQKKHGFSLDEGLETSELHELATMQFSESEPSDDGKTTNLTLERLAARILEYDPQSILFIMERVKQQNPNIYPQLETNVRKLMLRYELKELRNGMYDHIYILDEAVKNKRINEVGNKLMALAEMFGPLIDEEVERVFERTLGGTHIGLQRVKTMVNTKITKLQASPGPETTKTVQSLQVLSNTITRLLNNFELGLQDLEGDKEKPGITPQAEISDEVYAVASGLLRTEAVQALITKANERVFEECYSPRLQTAFSDAGTAVMRYIWYGRGNGAQVDIGSRTQAVKGMLDIAAIPALIETKEITGGDGRTQTKQYLRCIAIGRASGMYDAAQTKWRAQLEAQQKNEKSEADALKKQRTMMKRRNAALRPDSRGSVVRLYAGPMQRDIQRIAETEWGMGIADAFRVSNEVASILGDCIADPIHPHIIAPDRFAATDRNFLLSMLDIAEVDMAIDAVGGIVVSGWRHHNDNTRDKIDNIFAGPKSRGDVTPEKKPHLKQIIEQIRSEADTVRSEPYSQNTNSNATEIYTRINREGASIDSMAFPYRDFLRDSIMGLFDTSGAPYETITNNEIEASVPYIEQLILDVIVSNGGVGEIRYRARDNKRDDIYHILRRVGAVPQVYSGTTKDENGNEYHERVIRIDLHGLIQSPQLSWYYTMVLDGIANNGFIRAEQVNIVTPKEQYSRELKRIYGPGIGGEEEIRSTQDMQDYLERELKRKKRRDRRSR